MRTTNFMAIACRFELGVASHGNHGLTLEPSNVTNGPHVAIAPLGFANTSEPLIWGTLGFVGGSGWWGIFAADVMYCTWSNASDIRINLGSYQGIRCTSQLRRAIDFASELGTLVRWPCPCGTRYRYSRSDTQQRKRPASIVHH
jgi:hypothetical protein